MRERNMLKSEMVTRFKSAMRRLKSGIARLRIATRKKKKMEWHRLYGLHSYLKSALWTVPVVAMLLVWVFTRVVHWLDPRLGWTSEIGLGVAGAAVLYQTLITMTLSFIVFTFGSLLVAIQVASGQMTPRVIATLLLRDNTIRYTVGLFVFTLSFAIGAWMRTDATVHYFIAFIAAALGVANMTAFLYLIDYAARLLRPGSIVWSVGETGIAVVKGVYPHLVMDPQPGKEADRRLGPPARIVCHQGTSAVVLAVNVEALVVEARRADGIIEFVPHMGDFVAADEPLFLLYGGAGAIDEQKLRATVAIGPERTMEQDPLFAFRILLDIALKALSKAINDPTTAVLAIDQLHRLLRTLGKRHLSSEEVLDGAGQLRVIFRTPNWEDYVHLAFTELRLNGAESIQVVRRLRAMIENLSQTLPEHRRPALRRELDLLDRTLPRHYIFPEDLALARIPDSQGLGGASRSVELK
jgi:uncharacterized membrane protein